MSCRHHLLFEVSETGTLQLNAATLDPTRLEHTCVLDEAARGGMTLEQVGEVLSITRERVRQIEVSGVETLQFPSRRKHLVTFVDEVLGLDGDTIYIESDDG